MSVSEFESALGRLPWALAICASLAGLAYLARTVRASGAAAGIAVGTTVLAAGGVAPFVVLVAFFVLGSTVTRVGWRAKEARGLAEEKGGARGAAQVLANGALAALLAAIYGLTGSEGASVAMVGSLGAALADTAGSEIGQAYGSEALDLARMRRVPPGTPGAVSVLGSAAGVGFALLLALTAAATGLVQFAGAIAAAGGGVLASGVESVAAARSGSGSHHRFNLLNSSTGAAFAYALWRAFG